MGLKDLKSDQPKLRRMSHVMLRYYTHYSHYKLMTLIITMKHSEVTYHIFYFQKTIILQNKWCDQSQQSAVVCIIGKIFIID